MYYMNYVLALGAKIQICKGKTCTVLSSRACCHFFPSSWGAAGTMPMNCRTHNPWLFNNNIIIFNNFNCMSCLTF